MSIPLLVLYPHRERYYPQHEVYGRLPGYPCTFSAPDRAFAEHSRGGMVFEVHRSKPFFGTGPLGAGQLEHSTIPELDSLLHRVEPRVVISFEAFSAISFQVSKSRRRRNFRHVVLCDSTALPARSLWRYAPTTALFAAEVKRNADRFVVHTKRADIAVRSLGVPAKRIALIPPGVDLPPAGEQETEMTDRFRVLFLGSIRRNKGVLTLLRAFREVRRRHPLSELVFAGTGPLAPAVLDEASRNPGVRALGWVDEAAKRALLQNSHLYVLPSEDDRLLWLSRWEEQTAISAIEAMQAGTPTVGSDSGALPEIIGQPEAIFEQRVPAAIQAIIEKAMDDPQWRNELRRAQRNRARRDYDIVGAARILQQTLNSMLGENGERSDGRPPGADGTPEP